ncbi:MAG: PD-(D/E)XK nuclease family protein [Crocinitomicaceae bacterium]|nr:PD-(D/E)XK nuclease family protein [Crocinitomicaceae bacterium]
MQKFVDQVAEHIKNNSVNLENWVIILPSQRAVHYLQKALFEAYGHPIVSPEITTIYSWIQELTSETILDKIRLLLILFEVHEKHSKKEDIVTFDEFIKWGTILISDFDELDRYLIDDKQLFKNLRDIKEIENWSFDTDTLSENQQKFLAFWERLPSLYQEYNIVLAKNNSTYMGKAYRKVAENMDLVFKQNKDAQFLFAGFNALSEAELSIFKQLNKMGRAQIIMDADEYYLKDKNHEAGMFMREMMEKLSVTKLPFIQDSLTNGSKKIELIACSQTTGQAKVVGSILEGLSKEEINKTMILLADESLIVPMLKSIPKKVGVANITLGLPMKNSSLRTWVDLIFRIQEGIDKNNRTTAYYKDLFSIWNHPFVIAILDETEVKAIQYREKEINRYNTIFQNSEKVDVPEKVKNLITLLYTPWKNNWQLGIELIRKLNRLIHPLLHEENEFEKALLENFDHAIIDFQNCIQAGVPPMVLRTFKTLFNQQWTNKSIAYYGNPIEGLQVMGLLETRLLDFERILVLGMNEGKMPPTNPIQTMIPMDLRRYFGLPTPRQKQGLFAHHFYRLLHQCKEMYITYTTSSESVGSNEPSRYLMQLELELSRINPNIELIQRDYSIDNVDSKTQITEIQKTPELIERLDELFEKGTSASAIKTFITCSLDFYYKYVLKFGEDKKVEEEVESSTFGTFIHETLEDLFKPFSRRDQEGNLVNPQPPSIHAEDIEVMLKRYDLVLREKFSQHFGNNPESFEKGKNYLSFSMANDLTKRFLKQEKTLLTETIASPIFIESLEEELLHEMEITIQGERKKVRLKGFVDRIDSRDGKIRIIDYKTGKVDIKDVGYKFTDKKPMDETSLYEQCKKSKHFFQLLVYCFLYEKKYKLVPDECAIVSFVSYKESPFGIQLGNASIVEAIELFPAVFEMLLNDIYDPKMPFVHTEEFFNYCEYCV